MALFRIAQDANRVFTALSANVAASVVVESLIPRYEADQNLIWKFVFGYLAYTGAYMGALDIASVLIPIYPFSQLYPLVVLGPIMLPDALRRLRDVSGAIGDELRGAIHRVFGTKPIDCKSNQAACDPASNPGIPGDPPLPNVEPFLSPSECSRTKCGTVYQEHWQPTYSGEKPPPGFWPEPHYYSEQIYARQADYQHYDYCKVDDDFNARYPIPPDASGRRYCWVVDLYDIFNPPTTDKELPDPLPPGPPTYLECLQTPLCGWSYYESYLPRNHHSMAPPANQGWVKNTQYGGVYERRVTVMNPDYAKWYTIDQGMNTNAFRSGQSVWVVDTNPKSAYPNLPAPDCIYDRCTISIDD